jgi:hypothetical protein
MKRELLAAGRDPRGNLNRDAEADLLDRRQLTSERDKLAAQVADLENQLQLAKIAARDNANAEPVGGPNAAAYNRANPRSNSGLQKLKVEEDMQLARARGRGLFDDGDDDADFDAENARAPRGQGGAAVSQREFEAQQKKLNELWGIHSDLVACKVENLNKRSEKGDNVRELLSLSNSRIDGVLGRLQRLRDSVRPRDGELFDHVSKLLRENGEAYKKVNDYSDALLSATFEKLEKMKKGEEPEANTQQIEPSTAEPVGWFEGLFFSQPEPPPKPPAPAQRQPPARSTSQVGDVNPKAKSRFRN